MGVIALLVALPQPGLAEPLRVSGMFTLQAAIARVQTAGFDVRRARAQAGMAGADAALARAALRPQLHLSAVALDAAQPQLGVPVARQAHAAATFSLALLAPQMRESAAAAGWSFGAASAALDEARNDAVYLTVQAYRREQAALSILDARTIAAQDQQDHLRLTQARVAAGKLARFTLLRERAANAIWRAMILRHSSIST